MRKLILALGLVAAALAVIVTRPSFENWLGYKLALDGERLIKDSLCRSEPDAPLAKRDLWGCDSDRDNWARVKAGEWVACHGVPMPPGLVRELEKQFPEPGYDPQKTDSNGCSIK
jgi:hypothetical protein